jgi:hypothetical protein
MLLERDKLEELKMPELYALAHDLNVELGRGESKEAVINRILISSVTTDVPDAPQTALEAHTEAKTPAKVHCTIEQVKDVCNSFILRGMELFHRQEDDSWLMRIRLKPMWVRDTNTGERKQIERWREDSGTLNQPIEAVRRCARVLMSNAPTPAEAEPERLSKGYEAVA